MSDKDFLAVKRAQRARMLTDNKGIMMHWKYMGTGGHISDDCFVWERECSRVEPLALFGPAIAVVDANETIDARRGAEHTVRHSHCRDAGLFNRRRLH